MKQTASDEQIPYKIYLSEEEMPTSWYNLRADMKNKPAPLMYRSSPIVFTAKSALLTISRNTPTKNRQPAAISLSIATRVFSVN